MSGNLWVRLPLNLPATAPFANYRLEQLFLERMLHQCCKESGEVLLLSSQAWIQRHWLRSAHVHACVKTKLVVVMLVLPALNVGICPSVQQQLNRFQRTFKSSNVQRIISSVTSEERVRNIYCKSKGFLPKRFAQRFVHTVRMSQRNVPNHINVSILHSAV